MLCKALFSTRIAAPRGIQRSGRVGERGARLHQLAPSPRSTAFRAHAGAQSAFGPSSPQNGGNNDQAPQQTAERCSVVTGNCTPEQWWAEEVLDHAHAVAHHDEMQVLHSGTFDGPTAPLSHTASLGSVDW